MNSVYEHKHFTSICRANKQTLAYQRRHRRRTQKKDLMIGSVNSIEYIQIRVLDEYGINVIDDFLANVMTFKIHL